jgi:phosphotriesterase-related protein
MIVRVMEAGFAERILLSHDVCKKSHLKADGGNGFDFIPAVFSERLREAGLSADILHQLLVTNPARVLAR